MKSFKWMLLGFGCAIGLTFFIYQKLNRATPVYSGGAGAAGGVEVVPVLSAKINSGTTMLWCSSFQIAWDRLRNDVIKEPIKLSKSDEIAQALNNSAASESDLNEKKVFAVAGFGRDGIQTKINEGLAQKFPGKKLPNLGLAPDDLAAYAYLQVSAIFPHPYSDIAKNLTFKSSNGTTASVSAFGYERDEKNEWLKHQAALLFASGRGETADEFIVDLCSALDEQIVIACVSPRETLDKTLEYAMTRRFKIGTDDYAEILSLKVPGIDADITHRFSEIERAPFVNPAFKTYAITFAQQWIEFKLDRGGAYLKSEVILKSEAKKKPKEFDIIADRPFLLYMKRRDAKHPYFAMWVDNAELLSKK